MNFIEYEKQKLKELPAELVAYRMFKLTGNINDARLLLALSGKSRGMEWTNSKSKEL